MSIVRENLMNVPGYTPYCGGEKCPWHWPRTRFNGQQFTCRCGWESQFEPEFIDAYKAKWGNDAGGEKMGAAHPGAQALIAMAAGIAGPAALIDALGAATTLAAKPQTQQQIEQDAARIAAAIRKRARRAQKRLKDAGARHE